MVLFPAQPANQPDRTTRGTTHRRGAHCFINGSTLTTTSVGGTTLDQANTVTGFNATNSGSGDIHFNNTVGVSISGIAQTSTTGNVVVTNTGGIAVNGTVSTIGGNITLTDNTGGIVVGATAITSTTGAITLNGTGTPSSPDGIYAPSAFNVATGGNITFNGTGADAQPKLGFGSGDSTGGSLSETSTYYYVVTAVTASGETFASTEQSYVPANGYDTAVLSWTAVPGAINYNIYHSTYPGAETLLATVSALTQTFSDDGSLSPGFSTPPVPNLNDGGI